jgi:hypothetical protein
MSFNATAFTIAGTAIAIFGVALYMWDTRKDKVTSAFNQYTASGTNQNQNLNPIPSSNQNSNNSSYNSSFVGVNSNSPAFPGGSRRKRRRNKKTNKKR